MCTDFVCKISKVSARDILKEFIRVDQRFQMIPNEDDAKRISDEMKREKGWYIRPDYLLDVWAEFMKEGI